MSRSELPECLMRDALFISTLLMARSVYAFFFCLSSHISENITAIQDSIMFNIKIGMRLNRTPVIKLLAEIRFVVDTFFNSVHI